MRPYNKLKSSVQKYSVISSNLSIMVLIGMSRKKYAALAIFLLNFVETKVEKTTHSIT